MTPLAEVAPDWVHPRLRRTARELAAELEARAPDANASRAAHSVPPPARHRKAGLA